MSDEHDEIMDCWNSVPCLWRSAIRERAGRGCFRNRAARNLHESFAVYCTYLKSRASFDIRSSNGVSIYARWADAMIRFSDHQPVRIKGKYRGVLVILREPVFPSMLAELVIEKCRAKYATNKHYPLLESRLERVRSLMIGFEQSWWERQ